MDRFACPRSPTSSGPWWRSTSPRPWSRWSVWNGRTPGPGAGPPRSPWRGDPDSGGRQDVSTTLILVSYVASILVIVLIHEAAHFVAAKRFGIKVEEFFVGFGPRVWSFRRGETEYGIKALPLG